MLINKRGLGRDQVDKLRNLFRWRNDQSFVSEYENSVGGAAQPLWWLPRKSTGAEAQFSVFTARLNRLRKNSDFEKSSRLQWLKPDSLHSSHVRPEGRTLQTKTSFSGACKAVRRQASYGTAKAVPFVERSVSIGPSQFLLAHFRSCMVIGSGAAPRVKGLRGITSAAGTPSRTSNT